MTDPQWLEQPISRKNFHGPKDVWAIEILLYIFVENDSNEYPITYVVVVVLLFFWWRIKKNNNTSWLKIVSSVELYGTLGLYG